MRCRTLHTNTLELHSVWKDWKVRCVAFIGGVALLRFALVLALCVYGSDVYCWCFAMRSERRIACFVTRQRYKTKINIFHLTVCSCRSRYIEVVRFTFDGRQSLALEAARKTCKTSSYTIRIRNIITIITYNVLSRQAGDSTFLRFFKLCIRIKRSMCR